MTDKPGGFETDTVVRTVDPKRRRTLRLIWCALAIWTLVLSVGTSLYAPAPGSAKSPTIDWRRGLMVFIFVGGFLSLWMWLAMRQRLPRRFRNGSTVSDQRSQGVQAGEQNSDE